MHEKIEIVAAKRGIDLNAIMRAAYRTDTTLSTTITLKDRFSLRNLCPLKEEEPVVEEGAEDSDSEFEGSKSLRIPFEITYTQAFEFIVRKILTSETYLLACPARARLVYTHITNIDHGSSGKVEDIVTHVVDGKTCRSMSSVIEKVMQEAGLIKSLDLSIKL